MKSSPKSAPILPTSTAIETRRFRRSRGRVVCFDRHGANAAREIQECEHGVSAAHPSVKIEK